MMKTGRFLLVAFSSLLISGCGATETPALEEPSPDFTGRWDVTVEHPEDHYPSWFDLSKGPEGWEGRFVGRNGSARPIQRIEVEGERLLFQLPPQHEKRDGDVIFSGRMEGGKIRGTIQGDPEREWAFVAEPAPALELAGELVWQTPVTLSADLSLWKLRYPDGPNGWTLEGGVLANRPPSVDLVTGKQFKDFQLELEFRIPERSNSGVYLRGRYELQISDSSGRGINSRSCGGIYGFITPQQPECKIGEWNRYEIKLVGRTITVSLNGTTIIDREEIPGVTGGALDSREGLPGPLMLQGDHGEVEYRNVVITPAVTR